METNHHSAEEFNKCPFEDLQYSVTSRFGGNNFSFGKGGQGCSIKEWSLSIYYEDGLRVEKWKLPKALSEMIEGQEEWARESERQKIRRALGIK